MDVERWSINFIYMFFKSLKISTDNSFPQAHIKVFHIIICLTTFSWKCRGGGCIWNLVHASPYPRVTALPHML